MRRMGGGKRWDYGGSLWGSIVQKDLSDIFIRAYTKPYLSRRDQKKMGVKQVSLLPFMFFKSNEFSPDEPHEQSAPRSDIRETSAEADEARAGNVVGEECKGSVGPSSASGEML